jgi:hypothetical protein
MPTVKELRAELQAAGKSFTGRKATLELRLREHKRHTSSRNIRNMLSREKRNQVEPPDGRGGSQRPRSLQFDLTMCVCGMIPGDKR